MKVKCRILTACCFTVLEINLNHITTREIGRKFIYSMLHCLIEHMLNLGYDRNLSECIS